MAAVVILFDCPSERAVSIWVTIHANSRYRAIAPEVDRLAVTVEPLLVVVLL